jgi:hypothetical protein
MMDDFENVNEKESVGFVLEKTDNKNPRQSALGQISTWKYFIIWFLVLS